jgi:hypothetical protein
MCGRRIHDVVAVTMRVRPRACRREAFAAQRLLDRSRGFQPTGRSGPFQPLVRDEDPCDNGRHMECACYDVSAVATRRGRVRGHPRPVG